MEEADSFKAAQKMLIEPDLIAPVYFILAGTKGNQVSGKSLKIMIIMIVEVMILHTKVQYDLHT